MRTSILPAVLLLQSVMFYILVPQASAHLLYIARVGVFQQQVNTILPFTYVSAIGLFVAAFLVFRSRTSNLKAFIFAIPFPFAATTLFESIYGAVGYFQLHWSPNEVAPLFVAYTVSSILAVCASIKYWNVGHGFLVTLIIFVVGFGLWSSIGYPQIDSGIGYVFNSVLKVTTFVLFGSLLIGGKKT